MSDVFVSYARQDEPQAQRVTEALRAAGYEVWRDEELPAHRAYADVIEERLASAAAVVVLWSAHAAKSQWVRAEAEVARLAGTLVQTVTDGTTPPLPFNQIQCASLANWTGEPSAPGWQKVLQSVEALARTSPTPKVPIASRPPDAMSICVLPFANMSGDPEQEYFSDGISEDVTTDLSKVAALSVVARNTAFTFKGQPVNVCEVAQKLGVAHVLEGSVRKVGHRVRITAQLVEGASGDHVWAERYDRELTDIFEIQDNISHAIVDALKLKLLPAEKKAIERRGTSNVEAYNFYLKARHSWAAGNHGDVTREDRVVGLCSCALEADPNYAQAWALLSIAQSTIRYGFGKPGDDGIEAARQALLIDPSIAEAHCPLARQLIEMHRYREAEAEINVALQLDPDSWEVHKEGQRLHIRQRHFKEAAYHLQKCVAAMESDYYSWGLLVTCYYDLADWDKLEWAAGIALSEAEEALEDDAGNGGAFGVGARALAVLGERDRAKQWVRRGLMLNPDNLNMCYNFAAAHAAAYLNEPEEALNLLCPVMAKAGGTLLNWIKVDPEVDALREDPRFIALQQGARQPVN